MENRYVKIHLLNNPYCIDTPFTYFVPHGLSEVAVRGAFVVVPFGNSNKTQIGLVTEDCCPPPSVKTKSVLSLASEEIFFGEEELGLCKFMKEQTLCTVGDAVHAMVPSGALSQIITYYSILESDEPYLGRYGELLAYIEDRGRITVAEATEMLGSSAYAAIRELLTEGFIKKEFTVKNRAVGKKKNYYSLAIDDGELASLLGTGESVEGFSKLRSDGHMAILSLLSLRERMSGEDIRSELGVTDAQISALVKKGYIEKEIESVYRNPYGDRERPNNAAELLLSGDQWDAFCTLRALFEKNEPAAALLHGVTGSGKTAVMMRLIDHALLRGKGVIMLIPEISLTPQTVDIFCSRYGSRVAIIHSSLSAGERLDAYMRIKRGEADLVIGTRSAVFAPVRDLGLVIIDEEQEHTYKSENNPKYHARDIARFRCAKNGALMLLASATPSIESYKKASDGVYTLIKLKERYGNARLPEVRVVDMRPELRAGNIGTLSGALVDELGATMHRGEQAILFLNRRGYHNYVSCMSCGVPIKCPNCSVSMTYHTDRIYRIGELVCHTCGKRMEIPEKCPECNGTHIKPVGVGIQLAQRQLSELYPNAKIIRMDTDTVSSKNSYDKMLGEFRAQRAQILLGTQMVTKGHDFPNVTLVGVLNADASLYLNDFRANERTFSMLTQVIGRAGRSGKHGLALIQTTDPDNDIIELASTQNYEAFYENEISSRKLLRYPPFCDIAVLTVSGTSESAVMKDAAALSDMLRDRIEKEIPGAPIVCYGPFEAPVYKADGKYRLRMVIKCKLNRASRAMLAGIYRDFGKRKKNEPTLSVDLNPTSI